MVDSEALVPLTSPIPLPARIGKYELREYLGGGMAHVYRAQDTILGRTVALKILTEAGNNDRELRERFLEEARTASNISQDNIIAVYDFGEEKGRPFMVMEFLRGESLRDAMKGGRGGDLEYKLSCALQIARALEHIHARKIIHRDIKPENIHIDVHGKVKLMDFGIAKREGVSLTRAGFTLGTPYYMAPEQVMGRPPTNLVDVYAFGVMLMELLSGAKPIQGTTVERIFDEILNKPMNLEPLKAARVPRPVVDLIARCTAKNPADRPQNFTIICGELERALAAAPLPAATSPALVTQQRTQAVPTGLGKLPSRFQSQEWIIAFTAAAVVIVLLALFLLVRFLAPGT